MQTITDGFDKGEVDIKMFTEMYVEWTKLFRHFGSAIFLAFKGRLISTQI